MLDRMLALHGATLSHLGEENERLRGERRDLHEQHTASLKLVRQAEDEQAVAERSNTREDAIWGTLGVLGQAVAVRLSGANGGDGPMSAAIAKLFGSMSQEQHTTLMNSLSNEQIQLVISIQETLNTAESKAPAEAGPSAEPITFDEPQTQAQGEPEQPATVEAQ